MSSYHPEHELLLEYSSGSIHPSVGLCISVHLEHCKQCEHTVDKMDCLGGMMLETMPDSSVNPSALATIFERIDNTELNSAGSIKSKPDNYSNLPEPVQKLVGYDLDGLKWQKHGKHVSSSELIQHDGIKASLIRIRKGAMIPSHDHTGREITVILEGSFSDDSGVYKQGDFLVRMPGETHSPTATTDRDCLCLAVIEAPLRFSNPLINVVNKFMPL